MTPLIIKVLVIGIASAVLAFLVHGSFIRQLNAGELILRADSQQPQSLPATGDGARGPDAGSPQSQAPSTRKISLDEAKQRFDDKKGTFIDARPKLFYEDGHVAGAISFPRKDYEKDKNLEKIAHLKNEKVIIYCSGKDCQDSAILAGYLAKPGFRDIEIFEGGWPEWTAAGFPTEKAN
jgi:rhodanese-related sulfurtransferase